MREMQVNEMDVAYLAFYKGEPTDFVHKVSHHATCLWTRSKYSHVELVIDGVCYSASGRDGGVRSKVIKNLNTSGRWDIYEVLIDKQFALNFFRAVNGLGYDYLGVAKFVLPWIPEPESRWYCSELVAAMMGTTNDNKSPQELFEHEVLAKYRTYVPSPSELKVSDDF